MFRLWRKWIAYPIGWLVLMGAFLALISLTSANRGETYDDMESFHGRYEATVEGRQVQLRVTETIRVDLSNEHGILRNLITEYGDEELEIDDIEVRDAAGRPVEFREKINFRNDDIELRIGDPYDTVSGLQTYVISYTQGRAMVGNDRYQELYFNVNGTEWPNGFKNVSAELIVEPSLATRLTGQQACYQGRVGDNTRCTVTREGDTFRVDAGRLLPWENVTIAVGFQPDTVASPLRPFAARSFGWVGIAVMVAVGAVALGLAFLVRALVRDGGRDEQGVVTEFTPPTELEPIVAADFLGRPEKGAAAHLAWLVLNGHGTVSGSATSPEPGPDADDLTAEETRRLGNDLKLTWHSKGMGSRMRRLTEELFGKEGQLVSLSRAAQPWNLAASQQLRNDALDSKSLRHRLNAGPWILGLGFVAVTILGLVQIGLGLAGLGWWFLGGGLLAIGLLLAAVHVMPTRGRLTEEGHELRRRLLGLERFVTMSEANRIAWLQNAQDAPREQGLVKFYEKLLPWAIIFGVERSWGTLVGELYDKFPATELPTGIKLPELAGLATWDTGSDTYYSQYHRDDDTTGFSFWESRPDVGEGGISTGLSELMQAVGEYSSGSGDDDSSTRSSGRGWSGGSSSGWSGGSSGGGSSGGGTGGGGGGRW